MIRRINTSLSAKLLILLFFIGFIPYLVTLVYTALYGKEQILQSNIERESVQMQQIAETIDIHFMQLHRSLVFLSHTQTMEDIVVDDIDGRILAMLEEYKHVLGLKSKFLVVDTAGRIVTSTKTDEIDQSYPHNTLLHQYNKITIDTVHGHKILFIVKITSSQDPLNILGYLVMEYDIENLQQFNIKTSSVTTAIVQTDYHYTVGQTDLQTPLFEHNEGVIDSTGTLTLYRLISPHLQEWYLVYQLNKQKAFTFLDTLNLYLLLAALFGVILIALLAFYLSKRVVRPLQLLQEQTEEMVIQHRYDFKVPIETQDEVGRLGASFNALSDDIERAVQQLKDESQLRTLRLTQLIALFHRLLSSQKEDTCLKIALHALQEIMPQHHIAFKVLKQHKSRPSIYLYDFEQKRELYYGSLDIDLEPLQDDEKEFFLAVSAMISARLNQLRAFKRLQKEDEAKRTFISYLSHELRTPLHAILTQTQYLIGYEELSKTQLDKIAHIETSSQQLLYMINDLLDLARLEAGKYDVQLETVSITEIISIVDDVRVMLEPLAEQKMLDYRFTAMPGQAKSVIDRRLLRQVVSNLLSNALKFTTEGYIDIQIDSDEKMITIMIIDSGCGISADIMPTLFEPFVQYRSHAQQTQNSGVGLALSQRFAALFGAQVTISSEGEGKGTLATIRLKTI